MPDLRALLVCGGRDQLEVDIVERLTEPATFRWTRFLGTPAGFEATERTDLPVPSERASVRWARGCADGPLVQVVARTASTTANRVAVDSPAEGVLRVSTVCVGEIASAWTWLPEASRLLLYQQGCAWSACGDLGGKTWAPITVAPAPTAGERVCLERSAIPGVDPSSRCAFQLVSHPREPLLVDRCSQPGEASSRLEVYRLDGARPKALVVPKVQPESWVFHPDRPALIMNLGESWTGPWIPGADQRFVSDIQVLELAPEGRVSPLPELSRWMLGLEGADRLGPESIVVTAKLHPEDFARFQDRLVVGFLLDADLHIRGWLAASEHHVTWVASGGQLFEVLREPDGDGEVISVMPAELRALP